LVSNQIVISYFATHLFPIVVAMLDTVPVDVLTHIAVHLCIDDPSPPTSLLLTNRVIHSALSTQTNPNLYARLFRANFDMSAAERRLGDINAVEVTRELERRMRALARLGKMVRLGDVSVIGDELWVIYVMLIENGEFPFG
jgi:hypothetical protein